MASRQSLENLISILGTTQEAENNAVEALSQEDFDSEAKKYDNQDIKFSRQNVLDTVFLYKNFKKTDDAFMDLLLKAERLAGADRKYGNGSLDQRKLFTGLRESISNYLIKLDQDQEALEKEAEEKLKIQKDGQLVWAFEDDFIKKQSLFGIEMDLNKRRSAISEKRNICKMLQRYLQELSEGGLKIPKDAPVIDTVQKPLYIMDQQLPCEIIQDNPSEYPLFPGQPQGNDVIQRENLDRYFLSVVSVIAENFSEDIHDSMKDNGDGSVSVKLFQKDEDGKYTPVIVRLDKIVKAPEGIMIDDSQGCAWASCLERAIAASGIYDCVNHGFEYAKALPSDVAEVYMDLKAKSDAGMLDVEQAKAEYPGLFSVAQEGKPSVLRPWPRLDCIIEGEAGAIFEMILGEKFKCSEINIPKLEEKLGGYNDEQKGFYESVKKALEKGLAICYSNVDSVIVKEKHAYQLKGTLEDNTGKLYFTLRNPWGVLNGDINEYYGLAGHQWTKVPGGDFNVELIDFIKEFDYLAVTGAKRRGDAAAAAAIRQYIASMNAAPKDPDPKDESLDFKVISSYVKAIDDMDQIFESSRRYHGEEPDAYLQLLYKLKNVKSELLVMRGKPFSELTNKMSELTKYLDDYDVHCQRLQINNWRRKLRVAACSMLRDTIKSAEEYNKHPNMPVYEAYYSVYAKKLAREKGYDINEAAQKLAAQKMLKDARYFNKVIRMNLFYIKYGMDKEFMTELNTFK